MKYDKSDIVGWATINGRRVPITKPKKADREHERKRMSGELYDASKDVRKQGHYVDEKGRMVPSKEKLKEWASYDSDQKPYHRKKNPLGEENKKIKK